MLISLQRRKKRKVKRKAAMMKRRRRRRKKRNPKTPNLPWSNVFSPIKLRLTALDAVKHQCPTEKHHFDACAARVAKAEENPEEHGHHGHPEDCAEEFLHLMHCADKNIAEPLFRRLK
jgi:hypothetical protein